jgi:hypothetical protein
MFIALLPSYTRYNIKMYAQYSKCNVTGKNPDERIVRYSCQAIAFHKHGAPFDLVDEAFAVRIHPMLGIHLSALFALTPGRLRSVSLSRKRSG